MSGPKPGQQALDIGDIVEYGLNSFRTGPATYRVDAWLKPSVPEMKLSGYDMLVAGAMPRDLDCVQRCEAVLHDITPKVNPRGTLLVWCLREEATHVALTGICGGIAPIGECRVTGRVQWPDEILESAVQTAHTLASSNQFSDIYVKNL